MKGNPFVFNFPNMTIFILFSLCCYFCHVFILLASRTVQRIRFVESKKIDIVLW